MLNTSQFSHVRTPTQIAVRFVSGHGFKPCRESIEAKGFKPLSCSPS